jgi:hypothetical protein
MTKTRHKTLRGLASLLLLNVLFGSALQAGAAEPAAQTPARQQPARQPAQAGTNLFTNGDFSAGLTGWTPRAAPAINSQTVVDGHLRINPTGAVSQTVAVTPGQVHTMTAFLRINQEYELDPDVAFQGAGIIINATAGGAFIASSGVYTSGNSPVGRWTALYVIFTPAVDNITVNVGTFGKVFFGDDITTQMNVDFDNFTVTTSPTLFAVEPTSSAPAQCTAIRNLVANGGFNEPITNNATGWRTLVLTDINVSTAVTVVNTEAVFNPDGWLQQTVQVTGGKTYYASVRSRVDEVLKATPNGFLLMNIQNGNDSVGLGIFQNGPVTPTAFVRSYFTFTVPANVTSVVVNIITIQDFEFRGAVDDVAISECPIRFSPAPVTPPVGTRRAFLPFIKP